MYKKIGVIGGMGTQAGVGFLNKIVEYSPAMKDQDYPEILYHNNSGVPDRSKALLFNGDSPLPALKKSIDLFNQAGVDLIISACVTSYAYYEELKELANARILHPVYVLIDFLKRNYPYISKIGLIGTSGTLYSNLFQKDLEPLGYTVITLNEIEQKEYFMTPLYMPNGLKSSDISYEAKQKFKCQVPLLVSKGAELIVGACSEVPLVFTELSEIPFVDSMDILAQETVRYCAPLKSQEISVS